MSSEVFLLALPNSGGWACRLTCPISMAMTRPRPDNPDKKDQTAPARLVQLVHDRIPSGSAEERYRALMLASRSVVWRARPDGSIVEAWGWNDFSGDPSTDYLG